MNGMDNSRSHQPVGESSPEAPPAQAAPAGPAVAEPPKVVESAPKAAPGRPAVQQLPPYNVILIDDDQHTYAYVTEMLVALFAHTKTAAYQMAGEVDRTGRVIVLTAHRELAELKRDQIHAFGGDWRIPTCKGSMTAVIEQAP
jgi:ATP-dependent Clp protease adaptor protein ClpS